MTELKFTAVQRVTEDSSNWEIKPMLKRSEWGEACREWTRVLLFTTTFFVSVYGIVLGPPAVDSLVLEIEANRPPYAPSVETARLYNMPSHGHQGIVNTDVTTVAQAR